MAKEYCAVCGGPREVSSSYAAYCVSCGRERQRNRYKRMREEAGFKVQSRVDKEDGSEAERTRRTYLLQNDRLAGDCELCGEYTSIRVTVYVAKDTKRRAVGYGDPVLLVCDPCCDVATMSASAVRRMRLLTTYLGTTDTSWEMLITPKTVIEPFGKEFLTGPPVDKGADGADGAESEGEGGFESPWDALDNGVDEPSAVHAARRDQAKKWEFELPPLIPFDDETQ